MNALGDTLNTRDPAVMGLLQRLIQQAITDSGDAPSSEQDEHAAQLIKEFLDLKGWSARDLAAQTEILAAQRDRPSLTTSRKTIDRILAKGHVPRSRAKAAIALVMGVPPWKIWGEGQMPLAHQREQVRIADQLEVSA